MITSERIAKYIKLAKRMQVNDAGQCILINMLLESLSETDMLVMRAVTRTYGSWASIEQLKEDIDADISNKSVYRSLHRLCKLRLARRTKSGRSFVYSLHLNYCSNNHDNHNNHDHDGTKDNKQ